MEESPEETADSSAEMRERLERAMNKAVKKQAAAIRETYEKNLRATIGRHARKSPATSGGAFPDELARMKERMEAAIEQAVAKVRAAVQRDLGIEPCSTPVVKDDPEGRVNRWTSRKRHLRRQSPNQDNDEVLSKHHYEIKCCQKPFFCGVLHISGKNVMGSRQSC